MKNDKKIIHKKPFWLRGLGYYIRCRAKKNPPLLNLEFTKRCNAKCVFCQYWQLESPNELLDYSEVVKLFKPVVTSISGGEPLLRKDYPELIRGIRKHTHYISLISNGALLNEDSARKLVEAGVNHISVSLDYMGSKHDQARQIDGLYDHLSKMIPRLTGLGYRLSLNTIIMESNLDDIVPLAHCAKRWGASISYSAYCALKKDDDQEMVRQKRMDQLKDIVNELLRLKSSLKNIRNSDYYLKRIPAYFEKGYIRGCRAGTKWLHVTPDGYLQNCSELPRICHYTEFKKAMIVSPICSKCWYTCRGEAEAPPMTPKRFLEFIRS